MAILVQIQKTRLSCLIFSKELPWNPNFFLERCPKTAEPPTWKICLGNRNFDKELDYWVSSSCGRHKMMIINAIFLAVREYDGTDTQEQALHVQENHGGKELALGG